MEGERDGRAGIKISGLNIVHCELLGDFKKIVLYLS